MEVIRRVKITTGRNTHGQNQTQPGNLSIVAVMTNNPSFANLNPPLTEINLLWKAVANARSYTIERARIPPSRQLDARWYCYFRQQANREVNQR